MLPVIHLEPAFYKGEEVMLLRYSNSHGVETLVKTIKGVKWHLLRSCWYLPLCKESYTLLKEKVCSMATIESADLEKIPEPT